MKRKNWTEATEALPEEGVLCVAFFPLVENQLTGQTTGPTAMAYYRNGAGWVYADEPTSLRFTPTHWRPFGDL